VRAVLTAVRRGDEGAAGGPGEDDVARLVADEQRAHHARHALQADHADTVGQVIDHPDLVVAARRHRHRLEADQHAGAEGQAAVGDVEDLERVVGRVDRDQRGSVRRDGERPHLATLELHERRAGRGHVLGLGRLGRLGLLIRRNELARRAQDQRQGSGEYPSPERTLLHERPPCIGGP
jgi:hypothetical protein